MLQGQAISRTGTLLAAGTKALLGVVPDQRSAG